MLKTVDIGMVTKAWRQDPANFVYTAAEWKQASAQCDYVTLGLYRCTTWICYVINPRHTCARVLAFCVYLSVRLSVCVSVTTLAAVWSTSMLMLNYIYIQPYFRVFMLFNSQILLKLLFSKCMA